MQKRWTIKIADDINAVQQLATQLGIDEVLSALLVQY